MGIIDATLRDAMETFKMLKHHMENDLILEKKTTKDEVIRMLNAEQKEIVTMDKWEKIRDYEIE